MKEKQTEIPGLNRHQITDNITNKKNNQLNAIL